jgi:hypothetical protein
MRFGPVRRLAPLVASLLVPIAFVPAPSAAQVVTGANAALMTGSFSTEFGTLTLSPNGGSYAYNGGRVEVTRVLGTRMSGIWRQTVSGQRCPDGRYWGRFDFTFGPAGFTGTYSYCNGPVAGPWNGTRIGAAAGVAGGEQGWGVWASASGGRWGDPCAIQYNAARIPGNRYDASRVYRRVRTRATQQEADADIDHFGRYHRDQPDGVVKMRSCERGDDNTTTSTGGGPGVAIVHGAWQGSNGHTYPLVQNGNSFTWSLATLREQGRGTVSGSTITASWSGGNGSGGASGRIEFDANGVPRRIVWSNGVVFTR